MRPLRGVIFDVDGTLVDSNDAHAWSWVDIFNAHGHDATFDTVRPLIGMGGDKLMPAAVGLSDKSPEGERIKAERTTYFLERFLPTLQAFPKSRELLLKLKGDGLALVVASSARTEELEPLLEKADAKGIFEEKTSASDAKHSKPDPDIVKAALEKLGLPAEEVVMVGDMPYDLEAARRAGVGFIAFRTGGYQDPDFPGAIAVYDGPADLLARYATSPFQTRLDRAG